MWQGFGSRGVTGVASLRSCWKLPLCPTEPRPDGSKTDPTPAKAEPIRDSGRTSVITDLRRESCSRHRNSSWRAE